MGGHQGVCKPRPTATNTCWQDSDCAGFTCTGAVVCPCGSTCIAADAPGSCAVAAAPRGDVSPLSARARPVSGGTARRE